MARWSEVQLEAYMKPDEQPESALQKLIIDDAISRGWLVHSHKQSKDYYKVHTKGEGWADVVILMPEGRVVMLELKAKKGVMREEQKLCQQKAKWLGHEWHQIKTWRQYFQIVEGKP